MRLAFLFKVISANTNRNPIIRSYNKMNSYWGKLRRVLNLTHYFKGEKGNVLNITASTFSTILPEASDSSRAFNQAGSLTKA